MLFSAVEKWLFSPPKLEVRPVELSGPNVRRRRRAATAMEYLAVISLIFIVAMTAINYLAQATKDSMGNSTDTIKKASQGGNNPPPPP